MDVLCLVKYWTVYMTILYGKLYMDLEGVYACMCVCVGVDVYVCV